jgi:hypothetical protein
VLRLEQPGTMQAPGKGQRVALLEQVSRCT